MIHRMLAACRPTLCRGLALIVVLIPLVAQAQPAPDKARIVMHMLDYIGVDYPEFVQKGQVLDAAEYAEQQEFGQSVAQLLTQLPPVPETADLSAQAITLNRLIAAKADGQEVSRQAATLRQAVAQAYKITMAPKHAPDLRRGQDLFAGQCAACHGGIGKGDGPGGANLSPAPSNFHDKVRMSQRSVYSLYSTISLGVEGTGMPAFTELSEADRWALAFYVSNLATSPAGQQQGAAAWQQQGLSPAIADLETLVTLTERDAAAQIGPDGPALLRHLRAHPHLLETASADPLIFTRQTLAASLAAYQAQDQQKAAELALTAYLEGFELVEAGLTTVAPDLRMRIEREMATFRSLITQKAPAAVLQAQLEKLNTLLDDAVGKLGTDGLSSATGFLSAFVILLREGLEAILLLGAIIAFLVKTDRRDALPYVHAGWVGALALGGVTWFVAAHVLAISGATRELTEGITALLAAGILIYVGFWLHDKMHAKRWQAYLQSRITGSLTGRTLWALSLVSFLAVYREVFEVILFYQTLWVQAGTSGQGGVISGFATAALTLTLISWLIFRFGLRLPLGIFFGVSSALMGLLAVILAGKGISALQEAGKLPQDLLALPAVEWLGFYPSAQSAGGQILVALIVLGGFWLSSRRSRQS